MSDLTEALCDAVSSAIMEVCRNLLHCNSFVKITGSLTFDVDGQQMNVVISEQTAGRLTTRSNNGQRHSCASDKHNSDNAALKSTAKQQRRRGRPRGAKTLRGRQRRPDSFDRLSLDATTAVLANDENNSIAQECDKMTLELGDTEQTCNAADGSSSDAKASVKTEDVRENESAVSADARPPFACNVCEFVTNVRRQHTCHVARHRRSGARTQRACVTCNQRFSTAAELTRHAKNCGSQSTSSTLAESRGSTECTYCVETFGTPEELQRHLEQEHSNNEKTVCCQSCNLRFESKDELQEHTQRVHGNTGSETLAGGDVQTLREAKTHPNSSLLCGVCGYQGPSLRVLQRHVASHGGAAKPRVACDECDKTFTSASTLYHHKRAIHGAIKPYECSQCGARFNFNHSLKLHVLKHAGRRPHSCQICGKSYLTASHLKYHTEAIHAPTKRYVCPVCHKSFPYETSYKLHRRLHSGDRPFTCAACGKSFVARGALREHEKLHGNPDDPPREFRCDVCGRCYRTAALLRGHRRRHTSDVNRHVCEVCGRTFMYRSNLEVHASVHDSERTHSCAICGKAFKTASTLYSHRTVHRTDAAASQICTTCGKSFKTKQRLRAHELRHSGAKPHVCSNCGAAFPDRGGLSKHLRTVHAARARYACPSCSKTTNRLDNLRVHMKTHCNPDLLTLTAQELTISGGGDVVFDKSRGVTTERKAAPADTSRVETSTGGSISFVPAAASSKPDSLGLHARLPKYPVGSAVVPGVAGGSVVDLLHDTGAYVQHCLSFVAIPSTEYVSQADLIVPAQSVAYVRRQP